MNKSDANIKAPKIDINGNIVGSNNIDDSKVNAKSPNQTFEKNINQNQINLNKDKTEEKYDFIIQGVIQPNKDKNKNNKKNENIKINGNSNTYQKNRTLKEILVMKNYLNYLIYIAEKEKSIEKLILRKIHLLKIN